MRALRFLTYSAYTSVHIVRGFYPRSLEKVLQTQGRDLKLVFVACARLQMRSLYFLSYTAYTCMRILRQQPAGTSDCCAPASALLLHMLVRSRFGPNLEMLKDAPVASRNHQGTIEEPSSNPEEPSRKHQATIEQLDSPKKL